MKAKSNEEIRTWLAENEKKNQNEFTDQDVQDFRDQTQPRMQKLIDGTPSRAQFESDFSARYKTTTFKYTVFKKTISLFTVLFVCFGVFSAYRIGAG